jgi:Phosphate/sulphate permeases
METAALGLPLLIALIGVALLFDFLNGLHDAANSIATIVSTRVLKPQYAVAWAAFFNFIAFLFFGCTSRRRSAPASSNRHRHAARRVRRIDRGDRVERRHLARRHSVEQLACPDRRPGRRRRGQGRARRRGVGRARRDQRRHRALAAGRLSRWRFC